MHHGQGTPRESLGARGCSRACLDAAQEKARGDARPTLAGRTPVRHAEVMDQLDAPANNDFTGREYRNEPAGPGQQHETSDQLCRNKKDNGNDRSIGSFASKTIDSDIVDKTETVGKIDWCHCVSRELSNSLGRKQTPEGKAPSPASNGGRELAQYWRPQGGSNPRYRRERAVS
jgi:hypothetical protein